MRWTVVSIPEKSLLPIKESTKLAQRTDPCWTKRTSFWSALKYRKMWLIKFLNC